MKAFQQTLWLLVMFWKRFMSSEMTKKFEGMKEWSGIKVTCHLIWLGNKNLQSTGEVDIAFS